METPELRPPWSPDADYSKATFIIRRMNTEGRVTVSSAPSAAMPLIGFLYLLSGEVLVDVDSEQFLCGPGHLLLIPADNYFSIRYYSDAEGYTGAFLANMLPQPASLLQLRKPVHYAFWFDEAVFVGELLNMMTLCYGRGDMDFITKGLDILISRVKSQPSSDLPALVSGFLESVFSKDKAPSNIAAYAAEACVSENYLNRTVKHFTGRSVGAWIDIARLGMAKRLLNDTDAPVSEIASAVGLDDPSYFARFFKRHIGITPREFRNRMHGLS